MVCARAGICYNWVTSIPAEQGAEPVYDGARIKLYSFTIDCPEPLELAQFYARLLNWELVFCDGEFACVGPPGCAQGMYPGLTFQKNDSYVPPAWPEEEGRQQQMAHLDFAVDNLEKAVEHAVSCGAVISGRQFSDGWRVMFDPAGHPFCLCLMGELMDSAHFGLL